jgi:hypothetical protein
MYRVGILVFCYAVFGDYKAMALRQLKTQVLKLLQSSDWPGALDVVGSLPARQVVNPLFSLLYHGEPLVRWRAVTSMGVVVSKMADKEREAARIVMRRFMWSLNDESGGIGWGSPEAMGEIMARHAGLACEYGCILVSYANPEGNYLEHPDLQKGLLWALGRLGRVRPEVVGQAVDFIKPHLQSPDRQLRGMAVWALRPFMDERSRSMLQPLLRDDQSFHVYTDNKLMDYTIKKLVVEALTNQFI